MSDEKTQAEIEFEVLAFLSKLSESLNTDKLKFNDLTVSFERENESESYRIRRH